MTTRNSGTESTRKGTTIDNSPHPSTRNHNKDNYEEDDADPLNTTEDEPNRIHKKKSFGKK